MRVIIDPHAGPCKGVKRALSMVEQELQRDSDIVALGPIIHNRMEMSRLQDMGLSTVEQENIEQGNLEALKNRRIFIRSHGISKALQQHVNNVGATVCDGTCPTVHAIQRRIEQYYQNGYQIIIVGKAKHPEVIGLNGYCDNQATIIQSEEDVERIQVAEKAFMVSQTTVAHEKFLAIQEKMLQLYPQVVVKDTVCRQVIKRHDNMRNFAASVDVVLLVGGKHSSNTRVLFDIAKQSNPQTFWIEQASDIDVTWINENDVIGITGSASTPVWQLEKIQNVVENVTFN